MIPEIGHFALILALLSPPCRRRCRSSVLRAATVVWMSARATGRARAVPVRRAGVRVPGASFVNNDFSVLNVATNSNSQLPLHYRLAATWGSHEGSLLLWALMLALWTVGGHAVQPAPAG